MASPRALRGASGGPGLRRCHRWLSLWLLLALGCFWSAPAVSADAPTAPLSPIVVDDQAPLVDLWTAVEIAHDPAGTAGWQQMEASGAFAPPTGPHANLGSRPGAVWLRFAVASQSADPAWVLQIGYPMLQAIDVYAVREGRVVLHQSMGSRLPYAQRPLPSRTHAMPLQLAEGPLLHLYVRIESSTALLVPLQLMRPPVLLESAAREQLLQGLLIGLAGGLLAYSVFNALATRQWLFVQYAVMITASTTFFATFFGIGQQYLWPVPGPWIDKIAPLSMLVMLAAASPFVAGALHLRSTHPRLNHVFQALAAVALVTLVLSLAGVLDYRRTQLISSSLGPVPLMLALPVALQRARSGDVSARWLLLGWGAYLIGALVLLGLLRGLLPVNTWSLHAFQLSTTVEMVLWVQVLSMRLLALRRSAERAELEKSTLLSLAETDALTGLPNRRGLFRRMDAHLPALAPQQGMAVYLLDLDGFKPVNDRLGHDAGDGLLIQVGQRLRQAVRGADTVARLGGDEFVVVASGLAGDQEAQAVAHNLLAAFEPDFVVQGQACRVGVTVGYTVVMAGDPRPVEALLANADSAMYAGKQSGGQRVHRFGAAPAAPRVRGEASSA